MHAHRSPLLQTLTAAALALTVGPIDIKPAIQQRFNAATRTCAILIQPPLIFRRNMDQVTAWAIAIGQCNKNQRPSLKIQGPEM
jgi:hypothetical protein